MNGLKNKIGYRPTWAEVNLKSLAYNLSQVRKILPAHTRIMATIKADAYGHGLIPVARKLAGCGVDYFGVASIDEGIRLRSAGIKVPILIMGLVLKKDIAPLFEHRLTCTVCSYELAQELSKMAGRSSQKAKVHIKVDTGMGRVGVTPEEALKLIKKIKRLEFIEIEGVFTHFALADADKKFTSRQIFLFERLISALEKEGIKIPLLHTANSMAILDYPDSHFNMVRPGLVLYGLYPKPDLKVRLKPVLSLRTKVIFVKKVPKGCGISYGHIYVTRNNTTVVTLPIGYGDGYPRNLSNTGKVLLKGRSFKISGRICMDQIMVDVGNLKVRPGDEAVLIGCQAQNRITTEELALLSGTIPYEIVCGLGSRIPRVYIDK
jgi:alanine racemase